MELISNQRQLNQEFAESKARILWKETLKGLSVYRAMETLSHGDILHVHRVGDNCCGCIDPDK